MADITQKDPVVVEREQIAATVQKLLIKMLQKHEIDVDRAKTIAHTVVQALKASNSPDEIHGVIPHLSQEFIELKIILEQEKDVMRHEIEKKVASFVEKLIGLGKFGEAHDFAEEALSQLANRQVPLFTVDQYIEQKFRMLMGEETATALEPQNAQSHTVPVQPHAPGETPHAPMPTDIPTSKEPEMAYQSVDVQAEPGSSDDLVPIAQPTIPKDVLMPDSNVAVRDFSDRAVDVQDVTGKAKEISQHMLDKAKQLGGSIAASGKTMISGAQKKLEEKEKEREEAKEAIQKKKDEF